MMPEVPRSLVPHTEPQVGPDYFGYFKREIEELFSQKEEFIFSLPSKDSLSRTCADVNDDDIEDDHCDGKKAVGPSDSRILFSNGVEDGLSFFKKERLNASLKESVARLTEEVEQMLDPVLAMSKIKNYLRAKEQIANNPNSDSYANQSPYKKQKLSASPFPTGVATHAVTLSSQSSEGASGSDMDRKDHVVSSEESQCRGVKKTCLDCKTTITPQWRDAAAGPETLCKACGIRNKKKRMFPPGFSEVEKLRQELDKELQIVLDNGGSRAMEVVNKQSDDLYAKLGHMEDQLEKYLDVIMSKCRKMTRAEKQELRKLIQNLPPKNLDRVVDIIVEHRKLPEGHACDEIHIDLEEEDNVTLWRLYYYIEVVASVQSRRG